TRRSSLKPRARIELLRSGGRRYRRGVLSTETVAEHAGAAGKQRREKTLVFQRRVLKPGQGKGHARGGLAPKGRCPRVGAVESPVGKPLVQDKSFIAQTADPGQMAGVVDSQKHGFGDTLFTQTNQKGPQTAKIGFFVGNKRRQRQSQPPRGGRQ